MDRGTGHDESSPVLDYQTPVQPPSNVGLAARIVSGVFGLLFGLLGMRLLWSDRTMSRPPAIIALIGAAFLACVAFGLIRVRRSGLP